MNSFYLSTIAEQSAIMVCIFFALTVSLLLLLIPLDKSNRRWLKWINASIGMVLFGLDAIMGHTFRSMIENMPYRELIPLPMWSLWCFVGAAIIFFALETIFLIRKNKNVMSRNSVKQAFDNLPGAVCYFTARGNVKLCNYQMYRLFHTLTQSDLQALNELRQALAECDRHSGVIRLSPETKTYLFPDGKAWQYFEKEIKLDDGNSYTEAVFADVTDLYEKSLVLKEQLSELQKVNRNLKYLSDNALALTREQEILNAKTRLHDQMGGGVLAIRRILQHEQTPKETEEALGIFRKAVNIIKYDNQYPLERSELAEFMRDAEAIGVAVELFGELPESDESYRTCILAMRECLTNGVRHADATAMQITIRYSGNSAIVRITNNGAVPEGEVVPKGGLLNLGRHIENIGGAMQIESKPVFALTVTIPKGSV